MADHKPLKLGTDGATITRYQTGDTLAIDHGGTGATTAAGARTALGLAIGSAIQAWDTDLDALAALGTTGGIYRTGAGTFATRTLGAPAAGFTITNADGVAGAPTFVLANDLAALEALASTGLAVRTGTDTWVQRAIAVDAGELTVANGDGVAGAPTLGLATVSNGGGGTFYKLTVDTFGRVSGYSAVAAGDITGLVDATYVNVSGDTLTGFLTLHADPSSAMHAVTKQYVDGLASGMKYKESVRAATTANITLSAPQTIDGVSVIATERVLVKNQSTASQNGIYVVAAGAWTRATDADGGTELSGGSTVWVNEGTTQADTGWTVTNDGTVTIGSTAITWTQTSGLGQVTAGNGLSKSGNTLNIGTASAARIVVNADDIDLATVADGGTGTFLKVTRDGYGRITGTTAVLAADITALLDSDLTALANTATNGIYVRTGTGTSATRTITAPAAGITLTNGDGVAGNPTLVLANDLAALEGLGSTGFAARTAGDTWAQRSVAGTAGRISVTNGDGVSGNPTFDLVSGIVTPGTYQSLTVDTYGRVTAGTTSSSTSTTDNFTNGEASAIAIGRAVYVSAADTVRLAMANAVGTTVAVGIVSATSISAAASGAIAFSGVVSATTGQWDAVTGQTGGLTFGATYYLDNATAGKITSTAPASGFVVKMGVAMGTTKLALNIGPVIQL